MFSFQYDKSAACVVWLVLLFIPGFLMLFGSAAMGAELISFLMVWYQWLSQMNYAFLAYVISSQPGNTGTIW